MADISRFISDTFNLSWLNYNLLTNEFEYGNSFYLYGLLFIPLLLVFFILKEFFINQKIGVSSINKTLTFNPFNLLRFLSPIILFISFAFFIVALARPQKTTSTPESSTEGIDIMLTLDISGSMVQFLDFKPNRLEAAKEVLKAFVEGRKINNQATDNIGLVVFAGEAFSKTPLTTDYDLLTNHIESVSSNDIENSGTAIGNALAVSTSRIRKSEGKSKIIVLISDGENTAGNIDPLAAAQMSYAYKIKIYTIGIGKYGKVPFEERVRDFWTGKESSRINYQENTFNETQLKEIAKIGEGKYFRASNQTKLEGIFNEINKLEKTEIKSRSYKNFSDFFHIYIYWGILFFLIWLFLKATYITNAIHD